MGKGGLASEVESRAAVREKVACINVTLLPSAIKFKSYVAFLIRSRHSSIENAGFIASTHFTVQVSTGVV